MSRFALVNRSRVSGSLFLSALAVTVVLARLAQYLWQYVWPGIPVLWGQPPGVYVAFAGAGLSALLWLAYRGRPTRQPVLVAFLALLLIAWVIFVVLARRRGDGFAYDVFIYPVVIVGLLVKTPSATDVIAALKVVGWLVSIVFVAIRLLEMTGLIASVSITGDLLDFEKSHYWLPLSGTLGPEGRWPGPLGHNAMTGNVAAMLIVLAAALRGRERWLFGGVGVLTLLLTASRTSALGALAGLLVVLVCGDNRLTQRVSRRTVMVTLGAIAALLVLYVVLRNPNLTGRTDYWITSLQVWRTSPILGVGAEGMAESEAAYIGTNAHNLVIDALVKTGLLGAGLVVLILGCSLALGFRARRAFSGLALAIISCYLVIGIAEADQGWMAPSLPWVFLVLATLLAGRTVESDRGTRRVREQRPSFI